MSGPVTTGVLGEGWKTDGSEKKLVEVYDLEGLSNPDSKTRQT